MNLPHLSNRKTQKQTMVRRLFATMVLLVMLLLLAATIALFMIGRFTSAQEKTQEALSLQIKFFEKEIGFFSS